MQSSQNFFVAKNYLENNFNKPIIALNTGFDIWERSTSITQATLAGWNNYVADCWYLSTPPATLNYTVARTTNTYVTSNKHSQYCLGLTLSSAVASLPSLSQYYLSNRLDGLQARHLLGRQVVINGRVKTNKAGTYTIFLAYRDTTNNKVSYAACPITLLGTGLEEYFEVTLPVNASNFTPVLDDNFSAYYGITLAGNNYTTTGVALTVTAGSEAFCNSSQVNIFDNATNYFNITQFQIVPDTTAKIYIPIPKSLEKDLAKRYFERLELAEHLVNLNPGGTSHIGSIKHYSKRSSTPTITFVQTTSSGGAIANSSAVYYGGGNTAITTSSFAISGRQTSSTSGFSFTSASATPANITTGRINQDALINASL